MSHFKKCRNCGKELKDVYCAFASIAAGPACNEL